ncbi:MAG: (2Fe-2S)-binding protein [Methylocapsa sp.]|nr:(2Fe-2S)-binding protein [Methylocapsa sp.]
MIICSCNVFSDNEVRKAVGSNCRPQTPGAVYRCLGCNPCCGRCLTTVKAILNESLAQAGAKADNCPVRIEHCG